MTEERHDRNVRFFGAEGQERLRATSVGIVGIGGLGTQLVQQLSLLGVGRLLLIDPEELDDTNRNRYVGARASDPVPGSPKVELGKRLAQEIDPTIVVEAIRAPLIDARAFQALQGVEYVFGCLDNDGARLVLTELTAAYELTYIDLATEILPDGTHGGRLVVALNGEGCPVCFDELDVEAAQADLGNSAARAARAAIYGVDATLLTAAGPSVVSLNGVVASLGVTEFMVSVTGLRPPQTRLRYRGNRGIVTHDDSPPAADCFYCKGIRGRKDSADVERYLRGR